MATKINQKEYLKKYLSGEVGSDKKKKKKKRPIVGQTVKIIDDDVDVSKMQHLQDNDLEMLTTGEDAPQVVGVIDERPPELRAQDFKNSTKWKVISDDNGYESSLTVQQLNRESGRIEKSHTSKHSVSRKKTRSPDLSPVRKKRSPDLSPVRRKRSRTKEESPDLSPVRRKRSPDLSPKRRRSPDLSPVRRRQNRRSEDLSPPRRRSRRGSRDLSPRRRKEHSRSPDRSRKRRSRDLSPARKRHSPGPSSSRRRQSPDLSPKRRRQSPDLSPKRRRDPSPERGKMRRTLEGKTAGLQDAKSLRVETEKIRKRDAEAFSKMSDEMSGRNATIVMRDKRTGRIRDFEQEAEKERMKERKEQEKKAVYDRWGKGVKQVEDYRQKMDEESHEMSKPLARYSDDADLDKYLKEQEREGDPMLEYIRQKEREKQKESKTPAMPIYRGSYPPNRFGIRPGYRWDGVDRSNGYEKRWFDMQNKKKAIQEEAYRYSTEDL